MKYFTLAIGTMLIASCGNNEQPIVATPATVKASNDITGTYVANWEFPADENGTGSKKGLMHVVITVTKNDKGEGYLVHRSGISSTPQRNGDTSRMDVLKADYIGDFHPEKNTVTGVPIANLYFEDNFTTIYDSGERKHPFKKQP